MTDYVGTQARGFSPLCTTRVKAASFAIRRININSGQFTVTGDSAQNLCPSHFELQ